MALSDPADEYVQIIPPGLEGQTIMLQAFYVYPTAPNGLYYSTVGQRIEIEGP